LGSAGQVVYTAANSFMDTLAHDLAGRGVMPATSINWGPIKEIGSGATLEGRMMHQLAERRGLLGIAPEKAMQALELLLPQRIPQIGVMQTNWELLVRSYTGMLSAPWASELVGQMPAVEQEDLVASLKEAAPEDRTELLCSAIQRLVVMVMGYTAAEAPEPDQGLFELGLDSLLALELKNHIQNQIRKDFPATAIFDYPTIGKLAVYLLTQVLALPIATGAAQSGPVLVKSALDEIDQLSEAEVEARLARQLAAGAAP
jgi:acyl carrier protein